MHVTVYGARGSIATAGSQFSEFGGNTTCVEVQHNGARLIIDAGTGLRQLGEVMLAEARLFGRPIDAAMLFTHLHWDHIQGFPFFTPAFLPTTRLQLFGPVDEEGTTLEQVLSQQMMPPTFPITLDAMAANKRFTTIESGHEMSLFGFDVRARALCHPQGSLGYRISTNGLSMCFATDTEHPDDGSVDEALLDLARGVDLLIYDAQYTVAEYDGTSGNGPCRKGWGHSTYVAATHIAQAAGAKRLVLTHHDPSHRDSTMRSIEREAQLLFSATRAAREGEVVALA